MTNKPKLVAYITPDLKRLLAQARATSGVPVSTIVSMALWAYLTGDEEHPFKALRGAKR